MSRLLLLFIALFATFSGNSQSVCMQVVANTGYSGELNGRYYSWTVGEPFVATFSGFAKHLTQGFHQPDACLTVATHDQNLAVWGIEVYPNPSADYLQITFSAQKEGQLHASVFDLTGKPLLQDIQLDPSGQHMLDCQNWQAGIYFLNLQDQRSRATATLRFVKL